MTPHPQAERFRSVVKLLAVVATLYLFLVGIGSMSAAFKLMGTDYTEALLGSRAGPVVSLFIGILATTLVQSSSTTTSIVVGWTTSQSFVATALTQKLPIATPPQSRATFFRIRMP
jgi:sodium-dependent phosphate cotransporter